MDFVLRAARGYWRLTERAWWQIRRATVPLLVVAGGVSAASWAVGIETGTPVLLWAPAAFGVAMFVGATTLRTGSGILVVVLVSH